MSNYVFCIILLMIIANFFIKGPQRRRLHSICFMLLAIMSGVAAVRSYHFWQACLHDPDPSRYQMPFLRLFVLGVVQTMIFASLPIFWYVRDKKRERQSGLLPPLTIEREDISVWPPPPKS